MQAKLKTKTYDLVDNGVRQSNASDGANVLGLVLTNVEDMNELIEEATGCQKVEILDGETVVQTYEDYVNFQSVSATEDRVEVVMFQPSLVQQVANLKTTVKEQERTIEAQAQTIAEQEATIVALKDSQTEQDESIEGLGDAIIEMSEIVYE
jgi:hypothetical protein